MRFSFVRGRSALLATCALAVGIAASTLTVDRARADDRIGWVLANKPHAKKTYSPDAAHRYNSSGGKVLVGHGSAGHYVVSFAKLYAPNSVVPNSAIVTAVNTNGSCEIQDWSSEGRFKSALVWVQCSDRHGVPADAEFSLLYQGRSGTFGDASSGTAYLFADQPNTDSYTPSALYNYNSTGVSNTITNTGDGYYVHIPGLTAAGGNVQVTSISYGDGKHCNLAPDGWWSTGSGTDIHVRCYDSNGNQIPFFFLLTYTVGKPFSRANATDSGGAYAWANEPSMTTPYTPPVPWNFNSVSGSDLTTAYEASKGRYILGMPASIDKQPSMMLTTAIGSDAGLRYCNIFSLDNPPEVRCFKAKGVLVPSEFAVTMESMN